MCSYHCEENIVLITYNQTYEKIAMGLLSYISDLKNVDYLQLEMESYINKDNKKLFLWRDEETDNIVAVIGLEIGEMMILVRHLSVSPSYRNEGIVHEMLDKVQIYYPEHNLNGTLETAPFIAKWAQRHREDFDGTDE